MTLNLKVLPGLNYLVLAIVAVADAMIPIVTFMEKVEGWQMIST
ncbi:MAG: hypothetical protein OXD32_04190 [Endozoicomonadaceae bacterium]|nr:hypothetical protein [Endozoicomonadaceae bacterium]MCY4329999.1 hypothetical protein [Endozoicomonadaceae bacterium]